MSKRDPQSQIESECLGFGSSPWWAILIIAPLLIFAYAGTFRVPLLLDDHHAITLNPSIRNLLSPAEVLCPPPTVPTSGRPIANLTFAVNYGLSGLEPWSYHAVNLAIHVSAALALFGVLRRTLQFPPLAERWGRHAIGLSGAVALIWGLHPLQTQSVTYLSQRTEMLMALFYLLALYSFIRGVEGRAWPWHGLAVAAALLGVLSKQVIVSLPLVILLYDRTFVTGSFLVSLRKRTVIYLGLASVWVLAGLLLADARRRAVGFDVGVSPFDYALTQCRAVLTYLRLCFWPHPLIFDRGSPLITSLAEAWLDVLVLAGLLGVVAWAGLRRPRAGFCAAAFFLLLAPASSVVPVVGATIAENRAYLPLATVITLVVLGLFRWLGRLATFIACLLLAVAAAAATIDRNRDYTSEAGLWRDTLAKAPDNPRAHHNLALLLARTGDQRGALLGYAEALRLKPDYVDAHRNLADLLSSQPGRHSEAIAHYSEALRLDPSLAEAHYNLGRLLAQQEGGQAEAMIRYSEALRLKPDLADAHNNLANLLARMPGRREEAILHYAEALRLRPDYGEAHHNLAVQLSGLPGRVGDAVAHAREAARLLPSNPVVHFNLARQLEGWPGRREDAAAHYREALRLDPNLTAAREALERLGK